MPAELHDRDDISIESSVAQVKDCLTRVNELNAQYRSGSMHVHIPDALHETDLPLEQLVEQLLPASHAALQAASRSLFFSLPVAFDPGESVGPYLGLIDRDPVGRPYRLLDMGALLILGFPTFDWPHISFPFEELGSPKGTARREERTLKQLWDLLVSGRLPRAEKSKDTFRREMEAIDEFLPVATSRCSSRLNARI